MDKKIPSSPLRPHAANGPGHTESKDAKHARNSGHDVQGGGHAEKKHTPSSSSGTRTGRVHHKAINAKGKDGDLAGEEIDHHDLHESAERKKEQWEVQKTVQQEKDRDDQDDSKNKDSAANQQMMIRRQQMRANATQLGKKGPIKPPEPVQVMKAKRDGFERMTLKEKQTIAKTVNARLDVPTEGQAPPAHYLLKDTRDSEGDYFTRLDEDGQNGAELPDDAPIEDVDPEWEAAVQETRRKLHGLRGIVAVSRGLSDEEAPVVLVLTSQGLSLKTFETLIPKEARGYPVLTAIPFDALPLRREHAFMPSEPMPIP